MSLASPIGCIRPSLGVIRSYLQGTIEVLTGLHKVRIDKSLRTQTEQDFLLGFQDARPWLTDFGNGLQRRIIASRIHIGLYQIIIHPIAIG